VDIYKERKNWILISVNLCWTWGTTDTFFFNKCFFISPCWSCLWFICV